MSLSDNLATALQAVRGVFEMHGANLTPVNMLEAEVARLENLVYELRGNLRAAEEQIADSEAEAARLRDELHRAHRVLDNAGIGEGTVAGRISKLWGDRETADRETAENESDGREPDGYRTEGGRAIPTDR